MDADLAGTQRYDSSDGFSSSSAVNPRRGSKTTFPVSSDSSNSLSSLTSSFEAVQAAYDSLLQQNVVIFQLNIRHIDFCEAAAGQSWKLKSRLNGKTFWKSDVQNAERCVGCRFLRTAFHGNATPKIVYECGAAIEFELCSQSFFGSRVVATCAISVSEALRSQYQVFDLALVSISGTVVAHLQLGFKVICAPLSSIGISSLRQNRVSKIPRLRKEFLAGGVRNASAAEVAECEKFIGEAEHARACLHSAVDLHHSLQFRDCHQPTSMSAL